MGDLAPGISASPQYFCILLFIPSFGYPTYHLSYIYSILSFSVRVLSTVDWLLIWSPPCFISHFPVDSAVCLSVSIKLHTLCS